MTLLGRINAAADAPALPQLHCTVLYPCACQLSFHVLHGAVVAVRADAVRCCEMQVSLFRAIGAVSRNLTVANALGTLVMLVMVMLGGFVLTKPYVHPWWIWGAAQTLPCLHPSLRLI